MGGFGASGAGQFSSDSNRIDFGDFQSKLSMMRSNIAKHEEMAAQIEQEQVYNTFNPSLSPPGKRKKKKKKRRTFGPDEGDFNDNYGSMAPGMQQKQYL